MEINHLSVIPYLAAALDQKYIIISWINATPTRVVSTDVARPSMCITVGGPDINFCTVKWNDLLWAQCYWTEGRHTLKQVIIKGSITWGENTHADITPKNANKLSIRSSETSVKFQSKHKFSFKKKYLIMLSVTCKPFCSGHSVLRKTGQK